MEIESDDDIEMEEDSKIVEEECEVDD